MDEYPVDPAEPLSTERDADTLLAGALWSRITGGAKASPSAREQYAQLGAAGQGGGMQWVYGPRRAGMWAHAAAAWALMAAICLAWHYTLAPIGLDQPLALAALLTPILLLLALHCSEACLAPRWLVLTEELLRFPEHRYTKTTVELPLRELLSVRHELPDSSCWSWGMCNACGRLVLADANGAEYSIPGDCLPSQQDILAVVQHVEDAMQAFSQAAPNQILAVCCE